MYCELKVKPHLETLPQYFHITQSPATTYRGKHLEFRKQINIIKHSLQEIEEKE